MISPSPTMANGSWRPSTAMGRWSTLGPYYAMFPVEFVRHAVEAFCPSGGAVLDPFCGRGTVPYVAKVTGRPSLGTDLNPVAFLFSSAKTDPEPSVQAVLDRVVDVTKAVMPGDLVPENEFQTWAWCPPALGFLRAARRLLDWQRSRCDRTLMAVILVHLHGKTGNAISNQMHQTKGMAPDYALRWWGERKMAPPDIDPGAYFASKVRWRYRHGIPGGPTAEIVLGDARDVLPRTSRRFAMLLTSPPYRNVTNYRVDNWIRLWMLGEGPLPSWEVSQRYGHRERYAGLLSDVFRAASRLLLPDAPVYVRTDARSFTLNATADALKSLWPDRCLLAQHGRARKSQTALYGDGSVKPGEVDLLIKPKSLTVPRGLVPFDRLEASLIEPETRIDVEKHAFYPIKS